MSSQMQANVSGDVSGGSGRIGASTRTQSGRTVGAVKMHLLNIFHRRMHPLLQARALHAHDVRLCERALRPGPHLFEQCACTRRPQRLIRRKIRTSERCRASPQFHSFLDEKEHSIWSLSQRTSLTFAQIVLRSSPRRRLVHLIVGPVRCRAAISSAALGAPSPQAPRSGIDRENKAFALRFALAAHTRRSEERDS